MNSKLPALTPKEVLKALQRIGFYIHHQTGSHIHLRTPEDPRIRVVIPYHSRDPAPKTLRSIIRQAGLSPKEFLRLL